MIEIHFYGNLRHHAPDSSPISVSMINYPLKDSDTLESILAKLRIHPEQISTIFVNSRLLVTRNTMAKWLNYVQVRESPFDWDLSLHVKDGDRIGLFGSNMPALVV